MRSYRLRSLEGLWSLSSSYMGRGHDSMALGLHDARGAYRAFWRGVCKEDTFRQRPTDTNFLRSV